MRRAQPPLLELAQTPWVSLFLQSVVYLFTGRADGKFLGITAGDPFLATESAHRFSAHHCFSDLLFTHIMREALVISRISGR